MRSRRLLTAIAASTVAALVLAIIGFTTFHLAWQPYAAAEPNKAYTLPMLVARLSLGVLCTSVAGALAARVAPEDRRAPWLTGALFFAISVPDHLYPGFVWPQYPAWYHVVYLSYLVPVAGLSGTLSRRNNGVASQ